MSSVIIGVEGMTCSGCVAGVERAAERVPGVERARADLAKASVEVWGSADVALIRAAIEDAGYVAR